ncbi:MAG: phenylalanine--tRNA ligase subunit beta [Anaerolineae bacterium]|nr:phenylalanine--tRNA ligase subunit beta [Anaerolineae bacterium]
MRVPISWLKTFVDLTLPVETLAEKLTLAGLEVEAIEYIGVPGSELPWDRDKIFVGQVLEVKRHPNADRLLLATVDYGAEQPITVVTGAPNLKPGDRGQKVVLALRGARLYDGHKEGRVIMTLKEATLRGIKNDSMVCSEKELGLSDDHTGILILPDDAPVGMPLADYLGDVVLHLAILPNMARCASILGVAREVAALTGQTVRLPPTDYVAEGPDAHESVRIIITDGQLNPRFTATVVRDVRVGASPFWMQRRLQLCGMRPINNLVDISNYVMLELGQPNHLFDFHAVRPDAEGYRTLITRRANPGETLQTLDGVVRELQPDDILVCDAHGPLSLAGVMGGASSEVTDSTQSLIVEVATWHPASIRKTARHHNLFSEASARFARGVPPALAPFAQARLLHLLQTLAGGTVDRGMCDAYPQPQPTVTVNLRPARVRHFLGVDLPTETMTRILRSLDFTVEDHGDVLRVTAPDHRLDIEGEHDLIEEIARIHGYDALPATLIAESVPPAHADPALAFEETLRDALVRLGLQEIVTYRLTAPEREARTRAPDAPPEEAAYVTLANPLTPDRRVMRRSLLSGALEVISANLHHHERLALFELGPVYHPVPGEALPHELPRLLIALTGPRALPHWGGSDTAPMDFFDLKGIAAALLRDLHIDATRWEPAAHPSLTPGRTAAVFAGSRALGVVGELHPAVREAWDLPDQPVVIAEFDVDALRAAAAREYTVADVPRFPATIEDIAVVVDERVSAAEVEQVIREAGGALLRDVRLFDVYRGEQIGTNRKSLAWSLTYQAPDHTLSTKEVERVRNKIIRALEARLGATLRQA